MELTPEMRAGLVNFFKKQNATFPAECHLGIPDKEHNTIVTISGLIYEDGQFEEGATLASRGPVDPATQAGDNPRAPGV